MKNLKKKILFVIPSLDAGGGEKSLVNLLNTLDFNAFEVDLVLLKKSGIFLKSLPNEVTIISLGNDYEVFTQNVITSIFNFLSHGKISLALSRVRFTLNTILFKNKGIGEQQGWKFVRKAIPVLSTKYDAAIGFLEKSSIYFVVDCVVSKNKIGFIHNDYTKLDLDETFDLNYFKKLTTIATVSEECAQVLKEIFPTQKEKITVIYNIVSTELINKLASQECSINSSETVLLSIGRLHPQKGFDFAIQAAVLLKQQNINFKWYVIGEGAERALLEKEIEINDLKDHFILLGLKENPYPYIKAATIFVQPSRYEGKSIAIDEAKILQKPIVVTNFTTAKDQIIDGETGLIVAMNPESIANGISSLLSDDNLTKTIIANLKSQNFGTESEIKKIEALF